MKKLVISLSALVFSTGFALAENPLFANGPNSPVTRHANAIIAAYRLAHPAPVTPEAFHRVAPISGVQGSPQVIAAQAYYDSIPRGPDRDMPEDNTGNISRTSLGGTVNGHTGVLR